MDFDIPGYLNFLPPALLKRLDADAQPVAGVDGLKVASGLREAFPEIETTVALQFVCDLYQQVKADLRIVLDQRVEDRRFIDDTTLACVEANRTIDFQSAEYQTVLGRKDENGRVVVGPIESSGEYPAVDVPEFMTGPQITLFGPPDTAKMAINAMNALNRKPAGEPEVVTRLVDASGVVPRWGADNEDSKTPIMASLLRASENLIGCFDGTISFDDPRSGKSYRLDDSGLSIPIKRIPGLAIPDGSHLLSGNPLPLHLFDFALHLFHNYKRPDALMFYIPKLENEQEAAYLKKMISVGEDLICEIDPTYQRGSVRLFIVFENPRAIFRIREIARTLHPYFLGGSLGWHDFLASTARLFRFDPNYRIPVKADPDIVINHIRESHHLLVDSLSPIDGISIGGMYGILFEDGNEQSFAVSMVGYIRDVITQLKRGLDGFWVAHPAFVRSGIALVEAFRRHTKDAEDRSLDELVAALVTDESERAGLRDFIYGDDVPGLKREDPRYSRAVLAATIATSDVIANDDPEEVRYNVFQALQYLADWLSGNGCAALPATMNNAAGEPVFVRIMDDLATTERSRWELWAEVFHGRVPVELFDRILEEEVESIRTDRATGNKRTQIAWEGEAGRWYPIAVRILRMLVVTDEPVEFATELLLPFTFDSIRGADDPWAAAQQLCPEKYSDIG